MDTQRIIFTILLSFREENDDDDEDKPSTVLNFVRIREKHRARRSQLLSKLLRVFYGANRGDNRIVASDFTHTVWRYSDVQFSEDFRMTRTRFEVSFPFPHFFSMSRLYQI